MLPLWTSPSRTQPPGALGAVNRCLTTDQQFSGETSLLVSLLPGQGFHTSPCPGASMPMPRLRLSAHMWTLSILSMGSYVSWHLSHPHVLRPRCRRCAGFSSMVTWGELYMGWTGQVNSEWHPGKLSVSKAHRAPLQKHVLSESLSWTPNQPWLPHGTVLCVCKNHSGHYKRQPSSTVSCISATGH